MAWQKKPEGACRMLLVRHCETEGNLRHVFQGHIDTPVSPRGEEQLALLAVRCRNLPIDAIYTSPLDRAVKTAEAINQFHHLPIRTDPDLIEIHGGVWEGNPIEEFSKTHLADEYAWSEEPWNFAPEGGEPMRNVYVRVWNAAKRIAAAEMGKTVCVVSHGCAIRNILCAALGKPVEALGEVGWGVNTAISVVDFLPDGSSKVIAMNECGHVSVNPDAFTGAYRIPERDDARKEVD